jgi:O-antigen ligase
MGINTVFWDIHPFAKYLLVISVILFVQTVVGRRLTRERVLSALLLLVTLLELLFTYARSQLVGFVAAAAVVLYAAKKLNLRTLILFALIFAVLLSMTNVLVRFSDLFQPLELGTPTRVNSLKTRIHLWSSGLPQALRRPLWGHGADTFREVVGFISHNDYLGLFFDFGIAGPGLYLSFLLLAALRSWGIARDYTISMFDRRLGLIVLGLTISIALLSVAENMARDTVMWRMYLALLGCMLSAMRSSDRPLREPNSR